jgi:hypothetical protein
MNNQNHDQSPRSKLVEEPAGTEKVERVLRKVLRVVFATYAAFTGLFCVFGVLGMLQAPSAQLAVSLLNTMLMACASIMAFSSMKQSAAAALKYAALLFLFGFGGTAIYRLIFISGSSVIVDVSNFLIFVFPVALTFYCSQLSPQCQAPDEPSQSIAREDARSG